MYHYKEVYTLKIFPSMSKLNKIMKLPIIWIRNQYRCVDDAIVAYFVIGILLLVFNNDKIVMQEVPNISFLLPSGPLPR